VERKGFEEGGLRRERPETRDQRPEIGGWRLEVGGWRLEVEGWKRLFMDVGLENFMMFPTIGSLRCEACAYMLTPCQEN
jgi:hypothetical protein